jgi:DNA-binding FadR family transcriptional regulator
MVTVSPRPENDGTFSLPAQRIRVPKAAELVAERIRRQIIQGELRGEEPLPSEQALIALHGVSRPTIREAVRILEAEGLLYMQRGRGGGARVVAPNGAAAARQVGLMFEYLEVPLNELLDASDTIQQGSAEMLARTRTRADLAALKSNLREGRACFDDPNKLVSVTTAFHMVMVERVGNKALAFLYGVLNHLISESVRRSSDPDPLKWGRLAPTAGQQHHEDVVALIEARDAEGADRLWRDHIAECRSFTIRVSEAARSSRTSARGSRRKLDGIGRDLTA